MDESTRPPSTPPAPAHATTAGNSAGNATTNKHAQENFRSLLMKCAIASTPTKSLTPPQKAFIEKRIQEFFPTVHTPDHPPYAWMIENAIKQLNEEGGSNEEAISNFILEEYKDLPWAHAAFLKHHLKKLSESGNLVESHNGCYLIGKAIFALSCTCKPTLSFSYTPSPGPIPSPTCSLSPSISYSSSPIYASSSTSSSSQSFNLKRKGRKRKTRRNHVRKKSRRRKQNERGIVIHPKYGGQGQGRGRGRARGRGRGSGRGRGRGRGRGQGLSWNGRYGQPCKDNMMEEAYADQVEDEVCLNHMEAVEIQYLMEEDEAADENTQEKEKPQAQGDQDTIDVESEAKQSTMLIENESTEQEYRGNGDRIEPLQLEKVVGKGTIQSSHRKMLISEQGSKKVSQRKRRTHLKHTPQTEMERNRSRKRGMQVGEDGKNMEPLEATEIGALRRKNKRKIMEQSLQIENQCYLPSIEVCLIDDDNTANIRERKIEHVCHVERDGEDSMDELIEEVYMELKEVTEIEHVSVDDEAAEGNLQRKEHHQAEGDQDSANVECQAEASTVVIEVELRSQEQIVSEERLLTQQDQSDGEGMQHKINQQSAADRTYETSDVPCEEQGNKYSDDLKEQQLQESRPAGLDRATLLLEWKHLEDDQGSWTEGQNHAQIHVQENIEATEGQILLTEDDECSVNLTLKEVTEKQFQRQLWETELTLVSGDSQKQESNGIEQQDQLKGGEMKIIGKKKMCEGDCTLSEEESQIKGVFEVLEERNQQQIEQAEAIIETNQPEKLHCILVDKEKENEKFEHCDELTKVEQQKNEEKCPSGEETKVDEHPKKQRNEDQDQQINQLEQAVEKAEDNQPIEKSKRAGTETLKVRDNAENSQNIILNFEGTSGSKMQNEQMDILGNVEHENKCGDVKSISEQQSDISSLETSIEVNTVEDPSVVQAKLLPKQTMVKPECRQLRPRPLNSRPDQTKEQFDLPTPEKLSEANRCHKLRPRPSKKESIEVENRTESFTARAESLKRLELGARRSLRPRPK